MPTVKIGKYTIAEMSNDKNETSVWIEDTETGEGGQFYKDSLFQTLDKHYKEFF